MVKAISSTTAAIALACACCHEVSAFAPSTSTSSTHHYSSRQFLTSRQSSFTDDSNDHAMDLNIVNAAAAANDGATTNAPTTTLSSNTKQNPLMAKLEEKMGTIQEDRILFPELITGEVPRMFSSLEYNKSEQGTISAVHKAGSTLGAAALVAGTTVGAGILALPTATAAAGFVPSSAALVGAWAYMTMSGLLIAELSLNQMGESGKPGSGLLQLFETYLGPNLAKVGSGAYFFLHYAVMVAYIAQGGTNLYGFLQNVGLADMIPASAGQVLFAGATAMALFFAQASQVATLNNVLVLGVVASFLGIVGIGASTADFSALLDPIHQHPDQVLNAFPILFLSLVFQNIVPTVVNQLEGDRTKITQAIVGGTSVPLLMFLAWNGVILGNVLAHDPSSLGTIDPVALLQSGTHGGPLLGTLVGAFSELALITSLIGFVHGLLDALTDVAKLPVKGPEFEKWKPALFAGVFLPPLALSTTNPGIFYDALEYGGAFGVSTLFLVLPPLMVWKARYGDDKAPLTTTPMVPFGKIPLGSMYKAAGTLIIEQGCEKLGLIDFAQTHIAPILSHFTS